MENDASMGKFLCIFHMVSQLHKIHWRDAWTAHFHGWLGSLVVKALDLHLAGCEFNFRLRHCRVTTLGKLFTPTCLGRSQSFSDGVIDCGVRGRAWPVVFITTTTAMYSLGHGLRTLPAVPRSTQPSTLWDGKMSISFQAE